MKGFMFDHPPRFIGERDGQFIWKLYEGEDLLSSFAFSLEEWHQIVTDIDNMEDWRNFLREYSSYSTCYVMYRKNSDVPIAMCWILAEHGQFDDCPRGMAVSFHGGGWSDDFADKYYYAKGCLLIAAYLKGLGCRVFTAVAPDNLPAKNLIEKIGFQPSCYEMYELPTINKVFKNCLNNVFTG